MVGVIIEVLVAVIFFLVCLRNGIFIEMLSNIPFIGLVVDAFEGYFDVTSNIAPQPTTQIFALEIFKTVVFLIIFYFVGIITDYVCSVGKHEYYADIKKLFLKPISIFLKYFLSALITAYATTMVINKILSLLNGQPILSVITFFVLVALLVVAGFFLMADSLVQYVKWAVVNVILGSVLRLVAIECFIVYVYFLLNVPGMFEGIGSIIVMMIGISICIAVMFGTEFFEDWVPVEGGKHYRKRGF